ncbi:hypothetical protein TNCV_3570191 [Trichonephila clavipes]|nr:hypothetical protein TNCV_3570191 [Trichonephila clavipes]
MPARYMLDKVNESFLEGPPKQYGGYDTRLVLDWARVQVPNKAWMYLQKFCLGLSPEMDSRLAWKAAHLF